MSRFKIGIGTLFTAALCIGAIGVASASALQTEECRPHGTAGSTLVSCAFGMDWTPLSGLQAIKYTPAESPSLLKAVVSGVEFEAQCKSQAGSGSVENKGGKVFGSEITVSLQECAVTKPAGKCTVPATLTSNSLKSETLAESMKTKYVPTSGTTFMTVEVSGASCPAVLKGSKTLTGSATSIITNEESGIEEFTSTSGSELAFAGQAALFTGTNVGCTLNGTQVYLHTP